MPFELCVFLFAFFPLKNVDSSKSISLLSIGGLLSPGVGTAGFAWDSLPCHLPHDRGLQGTRGVGLAKGEGSGQVCPLLVEQAWS